MFTFLYNTINNFIYHFCTIEYILKDTLNYDELYLKLEILKYYFYILDNPSQQIIIEFGIFIFKYYFEYNINKLLKEQESSFLDSHNKRPSPINIDVEDELNLNFFESFYFILSNLINFNEKINVKEIKLLLSQINLNIKSKNVERDDPPNNFKKEIMDKINKNTNNIKEKINGINPIIFEKDDDKNNQINFILSFSNLRAKNYNIKKCNFLKAKEVSGNIIPAIASTTAAITGLSCLQIYALVQTNNIRLFRCGAINLAISEFDLFIPEEKRYIKNIPRTKTTPEYKVIPKEFTVWDKIDIIGPNITVKNIVEDFRNKYNVDIDYINYNNKILASPMEDDKNMNETIEKLIQDKTGKKINNKVKYIKLDLNGSFGDCEILTPTIRYVLKNH